MDPWLKNSTRKTRSTKRLANKAMFEIDKILKIFQDDYGTCFNPSSRAIRLFFLFDAKIS